MMLFAILFVYICTALIFAFSAAAYSLTKQNRVLDTLPGVTVSFVLESVIVCFFLSSGFILSCSQATKVLTSDCIGVWRAWKLWKDSKVVGVAACALLTCTLGGWHCS
jgi:hypothetical protein